MTQIAGKRFGIAQKGKYELEVLLGASRASCLNQRKQEGEMQAAPAVAAVKAGQRILESEAEQEERTVRCQAKRQPGNTTRKAKGQHEKVRIGAKRLSGFQAKLEEQEAVEEVGEMKEEEKETIQAATEDRAANAYAEVDGARAQAAAILPGKKAEAEFQKHQARCVRVLILSWLSDRVSGGACRPRSEQLQR